jgi:bloom syndrome protein
LKRLETLNIKCKVISGSLSKKQERLAYEAILMQKDFKIVFLTPEKLSKCEKLAGLLSDLYKERRIARFVIDEAHCVSKWGREFRADYLKLNQLRIDFPNVPILALTGTATDLVRKDVVKVLGMRLTKFFLDGFNRPNLYFQVVCKTKQVIQDISNIINNRFSKQTGLVYCVTKKDCEKVSSGLQHQGIISGFYHADVSQTKRNQIQQEWMEGKVQVLVATIAFGMGIDKPDVRFVIHHSFPKSIENYYQESGRAGRDGQRSDCIIFFDFADKKKHSNLINENKRQEFNFHEIAVVMKYCENIYTCRRKQILAYFGENFDETMCKGFCDNCRNKKEYLAKDVTDEALSILDFINDLPRGIATLPQIASFLRGNSQKAKIVTKGNSFFAVLTMMKLSDIETILRNMIYEEILSEKLVKAFRKFKKTKILVGPKAFAFKQKQFRLTVLIDLCKHPVSLPGSGKDLEKGKKTEVAKSLTENIGKVKLKRPELGNSFTEIKIINPDFGQVKEIKKIEILPKIKKNEENRRESIVIDLDEPVELSEKMEKIAKIAEKQVSETISINSNILKDKNFEIPALHSFLTQDMYEELFSRLQIVRKSLSKKLQKPESLILPDKDLEIAARSLEGPHLLPEFIREIRFFKEIHKIKDLYKFQLDLDSIEPFELSHVLGNKKLKHN